MRCFVAFFTSSKVVVRGECCQVILPLWRNVHEYFRSWSQPRLPGEPSLLAKLLAELVGEVRQEDGRDEHTSMIIIDSQSVKNTDTAGATGFAGGKNVKGMKRHAGVASLGLPQVIHLTTANVNDREAALEMFRLPSDSWPAVETVLADGGSTGEKFATGVREVLSAQVEIVKRSELHTFVVMPKRWVVERSFAWLDKCRRLWKNCERQLNTSLQMVVLAFLSLLLKRF
jgi:transposase